MSEQKIIPSICIHIVFNIKVFFRVSVSLLVLFLSIFLFIGFSPVLAEDPDPFYELDQEIKALATEIKESETDEGTGCEFLSWDKWGGYYYQGMSGVKMTTLDLGESLLSRCYRKTVTRIDKDIQRKLLDPFAKSKMACENSVILRGKIESIMQKRILLAISPLPNEYSTAHCEEDSRSFSFTQTRKKFFELTDKIKKIGKTFKNFTKSESSESKKVKENAEKLRIEKIRLRMKKRVEGVVNDFVVKTIVNPMYSERASQDSHLKSLPRGRSIFVSAAPVKVGDMFVFGKDENTGLNIIPDLFKGTVTNVVDNLKENTKIVQSFAISHGDIITSYKNTKTEHDRLIERLRTDLRYQEEYSKQKSYSQSIIDSLHPFHVSLLETTDTLNVNTKALQKVLNNQNL